MDIREEIRKNPSLGARRLTDEYGRRLFAVACHLCRNPADAEDLTFRTLARAVERIDQCRGKSGVFPWLYGILLNFLRMDGRRKGASSIDYMPTPPDRIDDGPSAVEALTAAEDAESVRRVIKTLAEPYRLVVVLRYFEDMSVPEMAAVLGIPEGTVKSRLNAAKALIREKLLRTIREESASTELKTGQNELPTSEIVC